MDTPLIDPDSTPAKLRLRLANMVEPIGDAMGLLRESTNDLADGNVIGSKIVASDALLILSELQVTLWDLAADLAAYSEESKAWKGP
jgi:hypothetical protein